MFIPINRGAIKNNIQEHVIDAKEDNEWTLQEIKHQLRTIKKLNLQWNLSNILLKMLLPSSLTPLY